MPAGTTTSVLRDPRLFHHIANLRQRQRVNSVRLGERDGKAEGSIGVAGEFDRVDYRVEIQRPVDMREAHLRTGVAGGGGRLELEPRGELAFIDTEHQEVALPAIEDVRGINHLRNRRAMNEA